MIKAVIFDMDGLMIDSEPVHYKAFKTVLGELGREFPKSDNEKYFIGLSDLDEAKAMITRYDLTLTVEEIVSRKKAQYKKLATETLIPKPGLMKLLEDLHQLRMKKGIASNSALDEIEQVISGLHINQYIDAYGSGEEVENAKPAPDVYLLVADRLRINPANCLVLEDASRGVQAAIAAGMKVFAIPSNETKNGDFSKATRKLNSLLEVFSYLQN